MPRPNHHSELPGYDEALRLILAAADSLGTESVLLSAGAGRVLRDQVTADRDLPPFNRATMDGFAVVADAYQSGMAYTVIGEAAAGHAVELERPVVSPDSQIIRIATGAAVPAPFDTVVPVELSETLEDGRVRLLDDALFPGKAVHRRGSDARAGEALIPAGTLMNAQHIGIGASAGASKIRVSRRPSVVLLSSGDELRPVETPTDQLLPEQIRNSNGPMLSAWLKVQGAEVIRCDHVADEADAVRDAGRRALKDADLVVTTGGVSVGQRDLFPNLWPALGCTTVLHGVAVQPGRPLLIAKHRESDALVVGLPGNPVSALVMAHLVLAPVLAAMTSCGAAPPWRRVWLARPVKPNAKREAFRFARLVGDTGEQVDVIAWQGSGDLAHTAAADGLVRLPQHGSELEAGTPLAFLPIGGAKR